MNADQRAPDTTKWIVVRSSHRLADLKTREEAVAIAIGHAAENPTREYLVCEVVERIKAEPET